MLVFSSDEKRVIAEWKAKDNLNLNHNNSNESDGLRRIQANGAGGKPEEHEIAGSAGTLETSLQIIWTWEAKE